MEITALEIQKKLLIIDYFKMKEEEWFLIININKKNIILLYNLTALYYNK